MLRCQGEILMTKRSAFFLALTIVGAISLVQAQGASPAKAAAHPFRVTTVGRGAPMILIPGLSSSGAVWDSTVAHYKDRFECHVLTLAGFAGEPAMDGPYLLAEREAIAQYIRDQHMRHPVIVGHSLGGFLALWLAAEHPELVGKVVIVDTLPGLGAAANPGISAQEMEAGAARLRDNMLSATDERRLQFQKISITQMATAQVDIDRIYGWTVASDAKTTANAMYEMLSTDLRPEMAKITAPTLVLGTWVAYEKFATKEQIEKSFLLQYKDLKNVQLQLAPTARHFMMYDQPDWMFAQMDGFLGKPDAR
jgi:pimeloyl-ACP methyl ester carboxylesterase